MFVIVVIIIIRFLKTTTNANQPKLGAVCGISKRQMCLILMFGGI